MSGQAQPRDFADPTESEQLSNPFDVLMGEQTDMTPASALVRTAFEAIQNGKTPLVSEVAHAVGASSQDVDGLIGRRLMVDECGRVVAAAGLSLVPARQHRLTLHGQAFWTWCAIDAIGIPAGLGLDAVAETTCHQCGTWVRVEFESGHLASASHPAARLWKAARLEGRGTAGPPHCALMNLFCAARLGHLTRMSARRQLGAE
jgi:alkylmercury lyase-like protein